MSRVCQISGKHPSSGQNRSHSMRATKRTYTPNVHCKRIFDKATGKWIRVKIATSVMRTMAKNQKKALKLIEAELKRD